MMLVLLKKTKSENNDEHFNSEHILHERSLFLEKKSKNDQIKLNEDTESIKYF